MRNLLYVCAFFAAIFLTAEPGFAQATLSEDCYWERPLLKARCAGSAYVQGEWPSTLYDDDAVNTGLVVVEPDNGPGGTTVGPNTASASAASGDTSGQAESTGSVTFNPPLQAIAEGALITNQSATVEAGEWDGVLAGFDHEFVMEAIHKLASATVPNGTWKPCIFKCRISWNRSVAFDPGLLLDWVVLGFPGQPEIWINGDDKVTLSIYSDDEYLYQEWVGGSINDPTGSLYVDVPGDLQVGDEVTWISAGGTGGTNLQHGGYTDAWYGTSDSVGAIVDALLRLEVHDPE